MLGPGNEDAAREALKAWPGKLQVGGGITDANAREWIENGAEKVIITSYLFPEGRFALPRLQKMLEALDGDTSKLVIDLSCRRRGKTWFVAMNKWQTITEMEITQGETLDRRAVPEELLISQSPYRRLNRIAPSFWSMPLITKVFRRGSMRSWSPGSRNGVRSQSRMLEVGAR